MSEGGPKEGDRPRGPVKRAERIKPELHSRKGEARSLDPRSHIGQREVLMDVVSLRGG